MCWTPTFRAGKHSTELVIDGVKLDRLEQFRSALDAYALGDQGMGPIH